MGRLSPSPHRRLARWLVWMVAAALISVALGFAAGLARPRPQPARKPAT